MVKPAMLRRECARVSAFLQIAKMPHPLASLRIPGGNFTRICPVAWNAWRQVSCRVVVDSALWSSEHSLMKDHLPPPVDALPDGAP